MRELLFYVWWHFKNRKWENTRQKRRSYERAWNKKRKQLKK